MRLYYFTEARYAVDDITKRRLKVSRFFDLNDPFELFAGEHSSKAFRRKMRDWAEKLDEQEGLLCFAESWQDPSMWSHYGDRHRGVCLGFDVDGRILKPINYSAGRLAFDRWKDLNSTDPPDEVRDRLLSTKWARWWYENERRVILHLADLNDTETVNGKKLFFTHFDDRLKLAQVIAGPRCCIKWKPLIKTAANTLPAVPELIKARLSFKRFEVVKQQLGFDSDAWQECSCPDPEPHDQPDWPT